MKNILKYIILFSFIIEIIPSCANKEDILLPESASNNGNKYVIAAVQDFSFHNVATKAANDNEDYIGDLTMLIFAQTEGLAADDTTKVLIAEPLTVPGDQINFVINTTQKYFANIQQDESESYRYYNDFKGSLDDCRLYLVANISDYLTEIKKNSTLKSFLDIKYSLPQVPSEGADKDFISIPEKGFPMVGFRTVDLTSQSQQSFTISMKKLFAKVTFRFRVQVEIQDNPEGMGIAKIPYFRPLKWSVNNIPVTMTLRDDEVEAENESDVFDTKEFESFVFHSDNSIINKYIEHSASLEDNEYFDFTFYVPEYKVISDYNAANPYPYPAHINDDAKQFYKPKLCEGKFPTYVWIKGMYSNYQGQISEVEYKLYLGQNETDDFQIIRNQELVNTALIKGLTNNSNADENSMSLDHRVDVTSSGYSIAMERETLLDSHYEFRPMDLSIQENAVVVVKFPDTNIEGKSNNWFAAERKDLPFESNRSVYDPSVDKNNNPQNLRKYFTSDLVPSLRSKIQQNGNQFVFKAEDDGDGEYDKYIPFRIWFYFDENVANPYNPDQVTSSTNPLYREGRILVDYYDNIEAYESGSQPKQKDREFIFRQMNLWGIHAAVNDYNIEYFEEYLYNYSTDEVFGDTSDGMEWGLENISLSNTYPALYVDSKNLGGWGEFIYSLFGGTTKEFFDRAFQNSELKYDFYLSRDNVTQPRDYCGFEFTKEIANNSQTSIQDKTITLSKSARSAVEYCYNKNKRDQNGNVTEVKWYLPSIDETEDILESGFNYFHVFQSRYYWSSQPAYDKYNFNAKYELWGFIETTASGSYYGENSMRARATIVTESNKGAPSGVDGAISTENFSVDGDGKVHKGGTPTPGTQTPHIGNKPRTGEDNKHRVRCAYMAEPHVYGNYIVKIRRANSSQDVEIPITLCNTNNLDKGNVMLSNYFHSDYKNTGYPQYADYDKSTGLLTIKDEQLVGVARGFLSTTDVKSKFYSGTGNNLDSISFKYDKTTQSFSLQGSNIAIRTSESNSSRCTVISFTRAD